jgi:uncharacterized membrane protein YkoI
MQNNEYDYVTQDWVLEQFHNLRFRISFDSKSKHNLGELEVINDMDWVKRKIEYLKGGRVLDRMDYGVANRLWKQYSNSEIPKGDDEWEYIDMCLKDKRKIQAIKTYRQLHDCGLREAKNAIDDRMMKNINDNLKGLI